ncbi:MAG: hemerythrin domain-containing protein [Myxococcaceae bacterium]
MSTITALYEAHHRSCDEAFADAENAAAEGKWEQAARTTARFVALVELHLRSEEETLFPAFEDKTGMRTGPTAMMRLEHGQMRSLLGSLSAAVAARSGDDFAGAAETLLVLMQQHNLKEENILYPMCDRALDDAALLATITRQLST